MYQNFIYSLVSSIHPRMTITYLCNSIDMDSENQPINVFQKFNNNYFYRAINLWNKLPLDIRKAENCTIFKSKLMKFLWFKFEEDIREEEM